MKKIPALAALLLLQSHPSTAQDPTFDLHVHLRNGAESIDEYEVQVTSAKRQVTFPQFGESGARLEDLSLLAVSHLHPDHVSDPPALLWLIEFARQ